MRLRSMFLVGCIALALPGIVMSVFSAVQAWTAWWNARAAAHEAEAAGAMMRAATLLMVERGYLHAAFARTADPEALARVAATSDAALSETERALHRAATPVDQARDALADARRRATEAVQRNLWVRGPTERLNRVVEGLQEETLRVERRIIFASPPVGMMVELARTANELRGIAGRRGVVLSTWLGSSQDLAPAQRDELLMLTGRLAGAWDRLQRGVRASSPSPPVTQAMAFTEERFFGQEEPWYRELVRAAVAGDTRPLSHAKYRAWSVTALDRLLPVRDALVAEAVAQGQTAIRWAGRDLLVGCAITLVSLVLVIAAVLALLRGLVQPVRRMTDNMAALAGGNLAVATSASSRLREIGAMAGAVEVFRDNTISLHQREAELQRTNGQFATALESMSQGLAMYDGEERLTVFNRRFCEITGIPPERVRLGMSYRDLVALGVEAGNFPGRTVQEVYAERTVISPGCKPAPTTTSSRAIGPLPCASSRWWVAAVGSRPSRT